MRRWKVYKDHEDRWLRWIAIPEHENWWQRPQGRRFPQWDMAVQYANRMAQQTTLTVKDPSGTFCDLTAMVNDQDLIGLKSGGDRFTLVRHEWKPLADFLLKEAKKREKV